nr:MAG TPA: hypothetical protein [Caudoviricetes sp.]
MPLAGAPYLSLCKTIFPCCLFTDSFKNGHSLP